MSSKPLLSKNVSGWESTWMNDWFLQLKWMKITEGIGHFLSTSLHAITLRFVFKQTYRAIFICSPFACVVGICRTVVRQNQNTCMCIYMPACVWHISTMKRTSLCSSFWVFHKLITSRQQGKCDSSFIQTVSAVVVIIRVSESVKDHKQRVWTGSSWFMSRAGKQQNSVDLCTRRTQKRPNVKHMAAAWSVDDSIQHVKKKISEVALALFFLSPLNFHKLLSASAHVGWCFLCRFEIFWHCIASIALLKRQQNLQKTTWQPTISHKTWKWDENTVRMQVLLLNTWFNSELWSWKCKSKDGGWPLTCS